MTVYMINFSGYAHSPHITRPLVLKKKKKKKPP